MSADNYIRWFSDIRLSDVPIVGGKNASLGELYSSLAAQGVRVPNGFALSAQAYRDALTAANAWEPLRRLLDDLDKRGVETLAKRAVEPREIVYRATGNDEIRRQAVAAYRQLEADTGLMSPLPFGALPRPRICLRRVLPASTKVISTFEAPMSFLTPAVIVSHRCSRIGQFPIALTKASTTSRSLFRSA